MTVTTMYKDYCEKYPENIWFTCPSVADCVGCLIYKDHKKEIEQENTADDEVQDHDEKLNAGPEQQHDKESCTLCQDFATRQQKYRSARIEYQKPVPENAVSFAADMQKVIVLPKLITNEHVFVSRLVTFNGTFASKTPGYPSYCVLWHEKNSGRESVIEKRRPSTQGKRKVNRNQRKKI